MKTCTFFGHSDAPSDILDKLYLILEDLIVNKDVGCFLVGNQGAFDRTVLRTLRLLKVDYPHILYSVVIPYLTSKENEYYSEDETVFPGILDTCPEKFSIDRRNKWMIKESDYVVCYIKYDFSRSAQYMEMAKRRKKTVINLAPSAFD